MAPLTRLNKTCLALSITQALIQPVAQAATITVTSSSDYGSGCSLREAIGSINTSSLQTGCSNGSASGFGLADTVIFSNALAGSTITLSGSSLAINNNMTITGLGKDQLTISGNNLSTVLSIRNAIVSISSLTLSNGLRSGVYTGLSTVTIEDTTISGNTASSGGGILAYDSRINLNNSTVSGNSATLDGGGINASDDTSVVLSNSVISGNSAGRDGGGIHTNFDSNISGTLAVIANNIAGYDGGGINARYSTSLALTEFNVSGNSAILGQGGGIYIEHTTGVILSDGIVSSNRARVGGGIFATKTSSMTLNQVTVTGNTAIFRGGGLAANNNSSVFPAGTSVTLNNSHIINNTTGNDLAIRKGGGIIVSDSAIVVLNSSSVEENSSYVGGGVYVETSGSLVLSNSTISSNSAVNGGGVAAYKQLFVGSYLLVTSNESQISMNNASGNGGGLFTENARIDIGSSTVSGNSAEDYGGGIFTDNGRLNLTDSTLSGNSSMRHGGGLYATNAKFDLSNSTISGNLANGVGGGVATVLDATGTITNSTISDNSAVSFGGGIFSSATMDLRNSIVAGNAAGGAGDEVASFAADITTNSANLFGDNRHISTQAFANFLLGAFDVVATFDGNKPTSLFDILRPLADNGGPTQTHALILKSPAIDAAVNSLCAAAPVNNLDQRGEPRPVGLACDIGAFEYASETTFFSIPLSNGKTVIFGL